PPQADSKKLSGEFADGPSVLRPNSIRPQEGPAVKDCARTVSTRPMLQPELWYTKSSKHSTRLSKHSTVLFNLELDNFTLTLDPISTTSNSQVGDGIQTQWRSEVRYRSIRWWARTSASAGCRRGCRRPSSVSASA